MWMEVHIYNVEAKSQAGDICIKDMTTQKGQSQNKISYGSKNLFILPENSAEGHKARKEPCQGYLSIYGNTNEKLSYLPPKSCHNFI